MPVVRLALMIERTKTKIKFESKSQRFTVYCINFNIERTKTKIKFESKSQQIFKCRH